MQAALYFPYIGVPSSPWWTRTILYWDNVGTIVPQAYRQRPEEIHPYTLDLIRAGLVHQFFPDEAGYQLAARFGRFLDRLTDSEIDRRRKAFSRNDVALIHNDKWINYASGLEAIKEMRLADTVGRQWTAIESTTAAEFMAALALSLCHEASASSASSFHHGPAASWVPTTDTPQAFSAMLSGLEPVAGGRHAERVTMRVRGEVAAAEIRVQLLEDLLPVPDQVLDVEQLLTFRRRFGGHLPVLRRHIEAKIDEALAIEDEVRRFRMVDRLREELEERVTQAEAYMRESWKRKVSRSSVLRVLKFIPGLKDPIETAQDLAQSTTSTALETEPLAYLAFAKAFLWRTDVYQPNRSSGISLAEAISV